MAQGLPLSSIRVIVSLRTLRDASTYAILCIQHNNSTDILRCYVAHSRTAGARARYSRTEAGRTTTGRTTTGR
jgi:hypothetical protein